MKWNSVPLRIYACNKDFISHIPKSCCEITLMDIVLSRWKFRKNCPTIFPSLFFRELHTDKWACDVAIPIHAPIEGALMEKFYHTRSAWKESTEAEKKIARSSNICRSTSSNIFPATEIPDRSIARPLSSLERVHVLREEGRVDRATQAIRDGWERWKRSREIKCLRDYSGNPTSTCLSRCGRT